MTSKQNTVIVGTGGHAQVMWAAWKALKASDSSYPVNVVGWLETVQYEGPDYLLDLPVFQETVAGWSALHAQEVTTYYLGLGLVRAMPNRWMLVSHLNAQGLKPLTLIHPEAIVSPCAQIEDGSFISAGAVVQPFASIAEASIINTGAIVEHHVRVGYNTHIAPGVVLCGHAQIGNHCMLGARSVVIQEVSIGDESTIGAGSVVLKDIPMQSMMVGAPAVPIQNNRTYVNVLWQDGNEAVSDEDKEFTQSK